MGNIKIKSPSGKQCNTARGSCKLQKEKQISTTEKTRHKKTHKERGLSRSMFSLYPWQHKLATQAHSEILLLNCITDSWTIGHQIIPFFQSKCHSHLSCLIPTEKKGTEGANESQFSRSITFRVLTMLWGRWVCMIPQCGGKTCANLHNAQTLMEDTKQTFNTNDTSQTISWTSVFKICRNCWKEKSFFHLPLWISFSCSQVASAVSDNSEAAFRSCHVEKYEVCREVSNRSPVQSYQRMSKWSSLPPCLWLDIQDWNRGG